MLEAKLNEAATLKRLLEAIKELVTDANFECNEEGINLQAMDNSHVALVAVKLEATGFKKYRCDRPMPLGVNLNSLTKVLKCAKDDDECTLKATDDVDVLNLVYEAKNSDRIAEYDMKLMDIDSDQLGIPETDYDVSVTMSAAEFARIVRDLSQLGESVRIDVSKEGIRFASDGEAANGNVLLRQTSAAREKYKDRRPSQNANDDEDGEGESSNRRLKPETVKKENDDVDMDDDGEEDREEFKAKSDDEDEEGDNNHNKKRKKAPAKNAKATKKSKKGEDSLAEGGVSIELNQAVNLTFSLKYLVTFSKSSALSNTVQLCMSNDVPLLVSYVFGQGHIQYYLAPKIGDD